jgi:quinolinate synthase
MQNPQISEIGLKSGNVNLDIDLFEEISRLKKDKNAIILAHYYQDADIQDIADYIGDSLGLSQQAAATNADMIVFAGVHFMAETAKIISPNKKVVLPDLKAGCSLADSCTADRFAAFKLLHPDHIVISYINCSAEIKAMTDIVCTSSNAVQIVESLPKDQKIIFAPDKNLGRWVISKTGRDMVLWDGACMVHEIFSREKIIRLQTRYPGSLVIAHPECEDSVLQLADFIGSTTALLKYAQNSNAQSFIVATESGILHQMAKLAPDKTFIPAPPNNKCACNECPHMKLNTLEKVYLCLKNESPEILLDESIRKPAEKSILRMLEISSQLGI